MYSLLLSSPQVYYISKAQLKTADKRYSSLNNDYEMTFNSDTQMIPCEEEVDLPTIKYNFVPISKLSETEANSTVGKMLKWFLVFIVELGFSYEFYNCIDNNLYSVCYDWYNFVPD